MDRESYQEHGPVAVWIQGNLPGWDRGGLFQIQRESCSDRKHCFTLRNNYQGFHRGKYMVIIEYEFSIPNTDYEAVI